MAVTPRPGLTRAVAEEIATAIEIEAAIVMEIAIVIETGMASRVIVAIVIANLIGGAMGTETNGAGENLNTAAGCIPRAFISRRITATINMG